MSKIEKNKEKGIKQIGAKAYNLHILESNGIHVPKWFCVINEEKNINEYLAKNCMDSNMFSVRSSTNLEDGEKLSFAGQFETMLFVEKSEIVEAVKKVRRVNENKDINSYAGNINRNIHPCVIIQNMIDAEKSGVMFTQNPNGILNEMVIVCGKGVGENIVEDKVPTSTYYFNKTDEIGYFEKQEEAELLTETEKNELIKIGLKIERIYGKAMDIEWCIKENEVYILQARPITTFSKNKNKIILDNSNIVESYPGITLPLTQDFVKDMYYRIFKNMLIRLTNDRKIVGKYEEVLKNMVDSSNGRMYYRISNWYFILSFLPAKEKVIKIWQEMLGVTTKKVTIDKNLKISNKTKLKVIINGTKLFKQNQSNMEKLEIYFIEIKDKIEKKLKQKNSNDQLIEIYKELIDYIMDKWDYTLINDFYSFIYTSLVKNSIKKNDKNKNQKDLQDGDINKYISQIKNLESMKPIKEIIKIAKYIKVNKLKSEIENIKEIEQYIKYTKKNTELSRKIVKYIDIYGDRSLEELKLETKTFRTNPVMLLEKLLEFEKDSNLDNMLNQENKGITIQESKKLLKYKEKAMLGIMYREQSRLNRGRIYGLVRKIMLDIGENLKEDEKIQKAEDIFYLNLEDILNLKDNGLKEKININKNLNQINRMLPQYSRLIYDVKIIGKMPININEIRTKFDDKVLRGIPSSSGIIKGEVVLIEDITKDYNISRKDISD